MDSCNDGSFGPTVKGSCRGGFDFTLLFEESILSTLPAACFLLLIPVRAIGLVRKRIKVRPTSLRSIKLGTIAIYAGLQLALLILWCINRGFGTRLSIAAAALNFFAAVGLAVLSHLEHVKSIRPSFLIGFYLLASLLFDIARVRTQWLSHHDSIATILTASVVIKAVVLGIEGVSKRGILLAAWRGISPEDTNGLFGRGLFLWLNGLLGKGFRSVLGVDDLFDAGWRLSAERLGGELQLRWDGCDQQRKHALALEALFTLRWNVTAIILPRLCKVALSIAQPFLINEAVVFIEGHQPNNTGYGLIGGFAFVYIGSAITTGWYQHLSFRLMAMIRGALIAVIYEKMLSLKSGNASESAAMTLMGTDVERIVETWYLLVVEIWASLIQLVIAIFLLERQLGAVCIAPVIVALVATGLSMKLATLVAGRQKIWLQAIQKRINFTSEILGSMMSVKMLGLTEQISSMIQATRVKEMHLSKRFRRLSSLNLCIVNIPETLSVFFTFAAFAAVADIKGSNSISTSVVITSLSILNLLGDPLSQLLFSIPQAYAALACFQRIQEFLLTESRAERRVFNSNSMSVTRIVAVSNGSQSSQIELADLNIQNSSAHILPAEKIVVEGGTFGWSEERPPVIEDICMHINHKSMFTVIIGPVGCGKSTFLKGLLGETSAFKGMVLLDDSEVAFCDQTPWITNASIRENIVGESMFDATWYDEVVGACALDTDLLQIPQRDETLLGSKGVILSGGQKQRLTIARAVYARKPIAIFDDVFSGLDSITEQLVFSRVFGRNGLLRKANTAVILATHTVKQLEDADHIIVLGMEGKILEQGSYTKLLTSGTYVQKLARSQRRDKLSETRTSPLDTSPHATPEQTEAPIVVDKSRQTGDWKIYKYYAGSMGWLSLFTFSSLVAMNSAASTLQLVWLNWWSESSDALSSRLGYWLGMLGVFGALTCIGQIVSIFYIYVVVVPKSAKHLHWKVLNAAMRAPMSFFVTTETGTLVNRFSQDMRLVDMTLPGSLVATSFHLGTCIAVTCLVCAAVGYFAIALPIIVGVVVAVQRFYLRTSRQLRLLELETKAPIYAHFIESLQGLITIRAFGWTSSYAQKNIRLIDTSQKPFYLLLCIQRWLVLVLDLVVAGMAILLISIAVVLRSKINPGLLGLALVNMMGLGESLASLVSIWTQLETSLGAIGRIKDFEEQTPCEILDGENVTPAVEWPDLGALSFEGVSASYITHGSPVLNDINLSIKPGEKIGICGRTGSGKSSFILTILRVLDLDSGRIVLDKHDLATLPRSLIRQKLTCLTQEPFLFTGTIRLNADPLLLATDAQIIITLKKVELWDIIVHKAGAEGLDAVMDLNFLSQGQRQLFCLARAMLRKGSVLILDEPTSSVDTKTDAKMQHLIREEFSKHTIIMVAHRIDSLLDFDRVVVLDKGVIAEIGNPRVLLEDEGSRFGSLYRGAKY